LAEVSDSLLISMVSIKDTNRRLDTWSSDSEQRRLFTIHPPFENTLSHGTDTSVTLQY